jgi:DHA2 family multidrug resistance protein
MTTASRQPALFHDPHHDWRPDVNPWIIAITVMLATFMEVLDTSVANVSLRHIAGNLAATNEEATWVLTSYLVSNAIVLPLSGWFSALLGRKRFYMICVTIFTLSSMACGLAPTLPWLVFFRVLQGMGGGALQPVAQAILVESFPRNKTGMAMAVYGMGVVVAPILGPTLGGWITDNHSWRWIFLINIPVGILSLLMTGALITDSPFSRKKHGKLSIDYIGLGLLSVGLGFMQVVLDKGETEDWFGSRWITWMIIIGVAALLAVIIWELRQSEPLVDLRLLNNRNFALATTTMFFLGFVLYASTMLLPLFVQTLMGYDALHGGLVLSPGGLVILVAMPFVGRIIGKIQARWMLMFGLIITAASLYEMSQFNLEIDFNTAVWARCVQGFGLAFLFVPLNTLAFSFIPKSKVNQATGIINLARNLGGSFGIAAVTTLISRRTQFHRMRLVDHLTPFDAAYRMFMGRMQSAFGADSTGRRAYAVLSGMVNRQATMLSYIDCFWLLTIAFLLMLPLAMMMKNTRPATASLPAH